MPNPFSTLTLVVLTLLSLAATFLAVVRLLRPSWRRSSRRLEFSLLGMCILGSALLFVGRELWVYRQWQPLNAHVDGLLLITALFGGAVMFLQRAGLTGLSTFALPLLSLLLSWAICASVWTYQPFEMRSVWQVGHGIGVYLGSLFFCIAAAASVMYLYAQRRLRRRRALAEAVPLASLEAIETTMVRTATVGFALLTFGLITGLVIAASEPTRLGPHWWYSPKVLLASTVWLIYALVMNVRYATTFRGARAAWLSIIGLVLLLAVFSITIVLLAPEPGTADQLFPPEVETA